MDGDEMALTEPVPPRPSWTLRTIVWIVALVVIFTLLYKVAFQKQAVRKEACLDQASGSQRPTTATASVEKYVACVAGPAATPESAILPARCKYAGIWSADRGGVVYQVTLDAGGTFVAEPGRNTAPNAATITGAWSVAGKSLVWAYDSGAVWPPDVNPVTAESGEGFTLTEVDGNRTRYTLVQRQSSPACAR